MDCGKKNKLHACITIEKILHFVVFIALAIAVIASVDSALRVSGYSQAVRIIVFVLITIAFFVFAFFIFRFKSSKQKQQSVNVAEPNNQFLKSDFPQETNRFDFETDTRVESIETEEELRKFCDSHPLIDDFLTKVKGVTFNNDDGTNRQEILSLCLRGERVGFRHYLFGGKSAYAVVTDHGEIGNLSADLAERMDYCYGSEAYISGTISDITGGYDGLYYGCILHIFVYGPQT